MEQQPAQPADLERPAKQGRCEGAETSSFDHISLSDASVALLAKVVKERRASQNNFTGILMMVL